MSFESTPGITEAYADMSVSSFTTSETVPIIRSFGKIPPVPDVQTIPPGTMGVERESPDMRILPVLASPVSDSV